MNKNIVIFKGVQNGLIIILDENATFQEIEKNLLEKVKNAKTFFDGANISITFKGKELSEDEEMSLLGIISKESGLDISFVNNIATINAKEEPASEPTNIEPKDIMQFQNHILTAKNNITQFHKGSIRSGQKIDFAGSVVVMGDVNPGGQIIAEGNVIILGKLKGVVHAGSSGDKDCFISALKMNPTQIIIGDCLASFPKDMERELLPEYAYVKDNQIFVEPLLK